MNNRLFRIAVCFTLIFTLIFCEATMCFATTQAVSPNAAETKAKAAEVVLKDYAYENGRVYTYTGKQIKPELARVVVDITYKKEDGTTETMTKTVTSFGKVTYKNNTSIGTGYAVTTIEGKTIEVPFTIKLGKVTTIKTKPVTYTSINISWNKVAGANGYVIYRTDEENGKFKKIKTIISGSTTSYTDTKKTLGVRYFYKVRPYRIVGDDKEYGEYSKVARQKARPLTPTTIKVSRKSYDSLKISWSKGKAADGYRIYRSTSPDGEYKGIATIRDENKLQYIDDGRTCGKRYYYKVRSYKNNGLKKAYSHATDVKSGRTTPDKTNFNENTMSWYSSVELSWDRSKGASGYEIYRSKSSKSGYKKVKTIKSSKTTKWTNTGLKGTAKYYYKIRPYKTVSGTKVYGAYSKTYTKYLVPKKLSTLIKKYEGVRYRFGGNTPKGWDCSGFVQWATYYLKGKKIGRTAGDQARGGKYVNKNSMSSWKPGDVLVYKRNGGGVSHVGLYIGGGKMMHALNSRYDTIIQDVDYYERWDGGNYLAAVRRY